MNYSTHEYFDMVVLASECNHSPMRMAARYAELYPDRRHPGRNVIRLLLQRLRDTGQLQPDRTHGGRPREARNVGLEEAVLDAIEEDPTTSTRAVSRQLNTNTRLVRRVLHEDGQHPYKYWQVQELMPQDYATRSNFCQWLLRQNEANERFIGKIMFSDESLFDREGCFNSHNMHFWSRENPHVTRERNVQVRWKVNTWAGIVGNKLIGPIIIPDRLTGAVYAKHVRRIPALLQDFDVPGEIAENMWFQHDGAGPHYALVAREVLNEQFPERWIGRAGPVLWPARSPDLNPLDFFLWGFLKSVVYKDGIIERREDLMDKLEAAIETITPEMLGKIKGDMVRRAQLCVEMNGGHFEHLL